MAPFSCLDCKDQDKQARNCGNRLDLDLTDVIWKEYDEGERKRIAQAFKKAGANKVINLGDIRLYECPLTWVTEESWDICRMLYLAQDTHVLYAGGGWANQPVWFMQAFELFRAELMDWRKRNAPKPGQGK